jgi:hypothetical protein
MSYYYTSTFLAVIGQGLHTNLCCLQLAMLRSLSQPGVTPASQPWIIQTVSAGLGRPAAGAALAAAGAALAAQLELSKWSGAQLEST